MACKPSEADMSVTEPAATGPNRHEWSAQDDCASGRDRHDRTLVDTFVGRWWVLHTRARNEKTVSAALKRAEVQHFLPLIQRMRRYGGRIKRIEIPLFPGYVFLCGTPEDRLIALKTNRIANVLEVPDQEQLKHDLHHICKAVAGDQPIDLYPGLRTGARCRVTSGSLAGLEGVVIRRRGPWRVYVGVDFLGQSAELEIDASLLEMID
jgi:transcriptional antiterminator RfaH